MFELTGRQKHCIFGLTLIVTLTIGACSQPASSPDVRRTDPTPEPVTTTAQDQPETSPDTPAALTNEESATAAQRPANGQAAPPVHGQAVMPTDTAQLVDAYNHFGFDLYAKLRERPGNLFYSPISIATALTMTYAGARSETAAEIARTLRLPDGDVHRQSAALARMLAPQTGSFALDIANRLWAHSSLAIRDEFRAVTADRYAAQIGLVDFAGATEQARQTINRWVSDKTANRIPQLLPQNSVGPLTRLVLTNAIYFKGAWSARFDPDATMDTRFYGVEQEAVPMMHQQGSFDYAQTPTLQVLRLPYQGDELSMLVVLPLARDGLDGVEAELSWPPLADIIDSLNAAQVAVWLPRFSSSSRFTLNETLTDLGMRDAFDPSAADFSGITASEHLYITTAIHQAFIELNEEGTEAAAATAVVMGRESAASIIEFRADHPFLYLIMHDRTRTVLFLGRMVAA